MIFQPITLTPHVCACCGMEFTTPPAGEIRFMGRWGDACAECFQYFTE